MEVASVPTAGISKVTDVDFEYAKTLKSTIKLIGTASLNADGSLAVFVSPTMVQLVNYFIADMTWHDMTWHDMTWHVLWEV